MPFEHNARTCQTDDGQTDKQTDHGTVTSVQIGEISPKMLAKLLAPENILSDVVHHKASRRSTSKRAFYTCTVAEIRSYICAYSHNSDALS